LTIIYILPSIAPIRVGATVTLIGVNFDQTVCLCTLCPCPPGFTGLAQAFPSSYPAFLGNISITLDVKVLANNKDAVLTLDPFSSRAPEGLFALRVTFGQVQVEIGKIAIPLSAGYYVYNNYKALPPVYVRFGVCYYITPQININFNLKSHYAKADFFSYGVGYKF
jgi:hypothetical protein